MAINAFLQIFKKQFFIVIYNLWGCEGRRKGGNCIADFFSQKRLFEPLKRVSQLLHLKIKI